MRLQVELDRACYRPGETVRFLVSLDGQSAPDIGQVRVAASICFLADEVACIARTVPLAERSAANVELAWLPPPQAPRGYGVDVQVLDRDGQVLATASTAFDLLEHWTQAPRYGFVTDFSPERTDCDEAMRWLARYHINGLQFYDWMYRHDQLLPAGEQFQDPLGRSLSMSTTRRLIDAAHARGIAAMPYTAVYGASPSFFQQHPAWALYDAEGKPIPFADGFLMIMNPDPGSPWTEHLLDQFGQVLQETAFDGIHLDQYGDPKVAYDASGARVDLAEVLPGFIDRTKAQADLARPGATVVFNCVGNWPIETVARSEQDFGYIEVWPPYDGYSDLHTLIVGAQALSKGKPVVLAVYIDPANVRNVRLADAVILASGGYRIELGEQGMMLADPYFPACRPVGDDLDGLLRRYYDFAVRFEDVLALGARDATTDYRVRLRIEGHRTGAGRTGNQVWPIVRQQEAMIAVSLINLLGLDSPQWDSPLAADPQPQRDLSLCLNTPLPVKRAWWATPDDDDLAARDLEFSVEREGKRAFVTLRLPHLVYWSLVVLELADESKDTTSLAPGIEHA